MCTEPTMLSLLPLVTGNLEKPVAAESSMIRLTGSVASTVAIRIRGVMISPAVRGPNAIERCTRCRGLGVQGALGRRAPGQRGQLFGGPG